MKKIIKFNTRQSEVEHMSLQMTPQPPLGVEIMSWKIKSHPRPTLIIDQGFGFLTSLHIAYYLYGEFYEDEYDRELTQGLSIFGICLLIFFGLWLLGRKRFITISLPQTAGTSNFGKITRVTRHTFSKVSPSFSFVAVLTMIALEPSFIWMLAGPGAMAIAASTKLMSFENPVDHHTTKWSRYDLVFIDRKRKMVVTSYQDNPLAGFEIHLEKRKINEFVALLKTLMPDAEFREAEWKW